MNLLQRTLVEKAGHDNVFEHVLPAAPDGWLALGSARHPAEVTVQAVLLLSNAVSLDERGRLGLHAGQNLRWRDARRQPYLAYHRSKCVWLAW